MPQGPIGPGTLVASRFRLEDLLEGHSGAWFWRATDLTLARNVAIHVIEIGDPRASAVLTAARTSATVSDGRILRVLDALEEGGFVHVVHEWGSGMSLDRMLETDLVEPRRAAWLVREVAEAITVAHRRGVAHGRLLPENVLLTDVGTVKLIGFVVGAVLHGRPPRPGSDQPPPSEHESDIRNLGGLLYACVTGRWPGFPESRVPDAPLDHGRVCRPRQVRSGIPKQLDALCDQLVNPDDRTGKARYETAADVVAALSAYLGDTLATTPLPVAGPTAFLDLDGLIEPDPDGTQAYNRFDSRSDSQSGGDRSGAHDAEATQPGVPLLGDTEEELTPPVATRPPPEPTEERLPERTGSAREVGKPGAEPRAGRAAGAGSGRGAASDAPPGPASGPASGMGAGAVPAYWGPDRPTDTGSLPPVQEERPGASWLRLAAVIGVLVLVLLAVLVGFYLGRTDPDDQAGGEPGADGQSGTPEVVSVATVTDFDPDDPAAEEHPEQASLAVDGDPSTAWQTMTYFDGPALAPYRSGVGLLLDLGSEQEVGTVQVSLLGGPYDLELLAAPEGTGNPPKSTEGLVDLAARSGASDTVSLGGDETVKTRYLVVWLTALPSTDGGYSGGISEISVRS